jgi:hypothetical protein
MPNPMYGKMAEAGAETWMQLDPDARAELAERLDSVIELEDLPKTIEAYRGMLTGMTMFAGLPEHMHGYIVLSIMARIEHWPQ